MINRILRRLFCIISLVSLVCISGRLDAQVNITSMTGGLVCPDMQYATPVMVTSLSGLDSLKLVIGFDSETVSFLSYRQVNPKLSVNGVVTVASTSDSVVIRWEIREGGNPVDLTDDKLLELVFMVGKQEGKIMFDTLASVFTGQQGQEIESAYIDAEITLFPALSVTLDEIDATCPGACEANVAAFITGGLKPYQFLWNGETSIFDSIKSGACGGMNNLQVTDANGCVLDTNFKVSELTSSKVEVETTPDTVYMQNPTITFGFTEDQSIVDWVWNFGDGTPDSREKNPVHVFSTAQTPDLEFYNVMLKVVNESGCDTTIIVKVPISETDIFIPNVFTPGGDDEINNYFKIAKNVTDTEKVPIDSEYIRMELVVFDRWGRKVYDNSNYRNNWDGGNLPESTYYYRLNTIGYFKNESFKGAVTILR